MNLLEIPKPPPVRNARVITHGMTIDKHKSPRKETEPLTDAEVRRIRFLRHRCKVWCAALDEKYQYRHVDDKMYRKKIALRARIMGAYGTVALGEEYGVSPETISKIARGVRYERVK